MHVALEELILPQIEKFAQQFQGASSISINYDEKSSAATTLGKSKCSIGL